MSDPSAPAIAGYIDALKTALEKARKAQAGAEAWLLSDRLLRMAEYREPAAFLHRAEASSMLSDVAAAQQDSISAFWLAPSIPGLADAVLAILPAGELRKAALRHALSLGAPISEPVLKTLATEGYDALVIARQTEKGIAGQVFAPGVVKPGLLSPDATSALDLAVLPLEAESFWPFRASFSAPWPPGAPWVSVALAGALVLPGALVATPQNPPGAWQGDAAGVLVIIPAYADWPSLARCLKSVADQRVEGVRLIVVEDASPDAMLRSRLIEGARRGQFELLQNPVNLGFSGAVNRGLAKRKPGEAVLVLNADATLPPGAIERLKALAETSPDIATITPLSNNGEDTSVPQRFRVNPEPDDALLAHLDRCAWEANGATLIPLPNGVGFCLYITPAALGVAGGFCGVFERGYFEDVDFCLRAARAGLRNLAAPGLYVAHAGSRSFGRAKDGYVRANKPRLHQRHPEYEAQIQSLMTQDPLAQATTTLLRTYLRMTPFEQVMIAPDDCPAAYAAALAPTPHVPALFLRPKGEGWQAQVDDGRFPLALKLEGGALQKHMPWLSKARISILDPERLSDAHRGALPEAEILSPLALPLTTSVQPGTSIGVAWPEFSDEQEDVLAGLFLRLKPSRVVMIDDVPLATEARLHRKFGIHFAGHIEAGNLASFARSARLAALVLAHPKYALLDPRRAAADLCGIRVVLAG